jgi:hypothetical protein
MPQHPNRLKIRIMSERDESMLQNKGNTKLELLGNAHIILTGENQGAFM